MNPSEPIFANHGYFNQTRVEGSHLCSYPVDLSLEKKAVEKKSATRYRLILTENWERMLSAGQLRMKNGTILTMGVRENAPVNPFASNSALKSSWEFCISIRKDDQLIAFDPSRAPIATVSDFSESAPRWSKFMIKAKNKSMGVIIARWILLVVNVQCPKATMMEYDIRDEKEPLKLARLFLSCLTRSHRPLCSTL